MAATGLGPALDGCPSPCVRPPPAWYRAHVRVGEDLHPTRRSSSSVLPTNTGPHGLNTRAKRLGLLGLGQRRNRVRVTMLSPRERKTLSAAWEYQGRA